jgi:PA14 domain
MMSCFDKVHNTRCAYVMQVAPYALRWKGNIVMPTDGTYSFGVAADDAALVYIDGALLITQNPSKAAGTLAWKTGNAKLAAGSHTVEVQFW